MRHASPYMHHIYSHVNECVPQASYLTPNKKVKKKNSYSFDFFFVGFLGMARELVPFPCYKFDFSSHLNLILFLFFFKFLLTMTNYLIIG